MATLWNEQYKPVGNILIPGASVTVTSPPVTPVTFALNNSGGVYTFGSAGQGYMQSFYAPETANLTDIYVNFNAAASGTWGSTDGVINFAIHEDINGNGVPGSSGSPAWIGTGTITWDGTTTGWIKSSGHSIPLTAGKMYCLVIFDADGGTTNFATMTKSTAFAPAMAALQSGAHYTTSNGFSTSATVTGGIFAAIKIGSIWVPLTNGFESNPAFASSTLERGVRFRPVENCTLIGVTLHSDSILLKTGSHSWRVLADATAPAGSALASQTSPNQAGAGSAPVPVSKVWPSTSWVSLSAETWYKLTCIPSAATTLVRKYSLHSATPSEMLTILKPFNGDAIHVIDNGAGGWTEDDKSISALVPLLVPTTAGGITEHIVG